MAGPSWQDIALQVQNHRDITLDEVQPPIPDIPDELPQDVTAMPRRLLSPREVEITDMVTEDLVSSLAVGKLTSTEVVNCITELLPERALARAKELDRYFEEHRKPIGPLHGLPISVKEYIAMKGLDYNSGFVRWVGNTVDKDPLVLKILWKAGCVFHARTTVPQTLMHLETSSNLYGTTVNPFNRALTAGGSSGGEGALLGLRGSCLGIGSDIGGSIRSPAASNGLYGLRPSSFRLPKKGAFAPSIGFGNVEGVLGPLSTSLEGVKLFMKIVIAAQPWLIDPSLVPLPWRDEKVNHQDIGSRTLRIGVMWHDGVVKPHPPISRALKEVVDKLKDVKNIEIIEWKPYKHDLCWEIISTIYFLDGGAEVKNIIDSSGEPWRPLSRFIITENPYVKDHTLAEVQTLAKKRENYKMEYAQKWNSTATCVDEYGNPQETIDVILCPAGPGAASLLDCSRYWGYTSQWNLLDYPALVFPVTRVDPAMDLWDHEYTPINEHDHYNHNLYKEPEKYRGTPVSLQLVGRRYEDEKVVEIFDFLQKQTGLPFASYI